MSALAVALVRRCWRVGNVVTSTTCPHSLRLSHRIDGPWRRSLTRCASGLWPRAASSHRDEGLNSSGCFTQTGEWLTGTRQNIHARGNIGRADTAGRHSKRNEPNSGPVIDKNLGNSTGKSQGLVSKPWVRKPPQVQSLDKVVDALNAMSQSSFSTPSLLAPALDQFGRSCKLTLLQSRRGGGDEGDIKARARPVLERLYGGASDTVREMNARQLGMVCVGTKFGSLVAPPPPKLCREIEARAATTAASIGASDIRKILTWFSWNQITTPSLETVDLLLARLYDVRDDVTRPHQWMQLLQPFATFQRKYPGLFHQHKHLSATTLLRLPNFDEVNDGQFLTLLRALANLNWGSTDLSAQVMIRCRNLAHTTAASDCAAYIWCFAKLGLQVDATVMAFMGSAMRSEIEKTVAAASFTRRHVKSGLNHRELGNLIWAYGILKIRPNPEELEVFEQLVIKQAPTMPTKVLANVIWGFASLGGHVNEKVTAAIMARANSQLSECQRRSRDKTRFTTTELAVQAGFWLPASTTILWSLTALQAMTSVNALPLLSHVGCLLEESTSGITTRHSRARDRYKLQTNATKLHAVFSHIEHLDKLESVSNPKSLKMMEALQDFTKRNAQVVDACAREYRKRLVHLGISSDETGATLDRIGIESHASRLRDALMILLPDTEKEVVFGGAGGPYLLDFYSRKTNCCVELNGPFHYTFGYASNKWGAPQVDGTTLLKERRLKLAGLKIVAVSVDELDSVDDDSLHDLLLQKLWNAGVSKNVLGISEPPLPKTINSTTAPVTEGAGCATEKNSVQTRLRAAFDAREKPMYKCSHCGQVYVERERAANHVSGRTTKWKTCAGVGASVVTNMDTT